MIRVGSVLFFIIVSLFGSVRVSVDQNTIKYGESVTLSIIANGDNIEFPNINKIGGYRVEARSTNTQIHIINGKRSYQKELKLTFTPLKSVLVKPIKLQIDGVAQSTQPVSIKVSRSMSGTKSQDSFQYIMSVNKSNAYIGEAIELTLLFKRDNRAKLLDIEFYEPKFDNFWVKKIGNEKNYQESNYTVYELKYLIYPQKSGIINIDPNYIQIAVPQGTRDAFGFSINIPKYSKIYSNTLSLNIKKLPNNLKLVGDFNMSAKINKSEVKAGEAVNLTIFISGEGNFDDIETQRLDIANATIYAESPKKSAKMIDSKIVNTFKQNFAIIANEDFTIPSINIKYFNTKSNKIYTLKSKEFHIKVLNPNINSNIKIETNKSIQDGKKEQKSNLFYIAIGFIIGIITIVGLWVLYRVYSGIKIDKRESKKSQSKDKEILKRLMVYINDLDAKEYIQQYEARLYKKKNTNINKKKVLKLLNRLEK